ncbi:Tex family protein [Actinomycetota bacterium]
MKSEYIDIIAGSLKLKKWQIENTVKLLEEGATVPFISRYRKEATGVLDEVVITDIRDDLARLIEIDSRREAILKEIGKQGKLTDELKEQIEDAVTLTELEDIYLPYKQKKKTKGKVAKEKGLEDLAKIIYAQENIDPEEEAKKFLSDKVQSIDEALQGARDIIAEWVNEDKKARDSIREIFRREAIIKSKLYEGLEESGAKYRDYFDFEEDLAKCPSHRLLAMRRGEKEEYLKVSIKIDEESALTSLEKIFIIIDKNESSGHMKIAIKDGYKRLLLPSIENEFAKESKEIADGEAIKVFTANLRQLLLAPILGQKRVLAIDPGYRTGCKITVLNEQGDLLLNDTIYPHPPQLETEDAGLKLTDLAEEYRIDAIAIGNGTASRETKDFVDGIDFAREIGVFVVSENGASIYSASKVAREEFPDKDVTVRGSVSIGRRLMDPLAELVKIDPKNMGVGQYQHDVDQAELKKSLDQVVESCVNLVGVNLNTASRHLLTYVSGLGPGLALNIVNYRTENGPFGSREEILKVPRMGGKAFEQCAGFLRIQDGQNPLDNSAVHPESYYIVKKMAEDMNTSIKNLISVSELQDKIRLDDYVDDKVGLPTLKDILQELSKPGRDPRDKISIFEFKKGIKSLEDLQIGMILPGIVTNITNFGAFIDVGVKQDGLVHISQLSHDYVQNPNDIVLLHQEVKVKVTDIDLDRKRIQLSLKDAV